MIAFLPRVFLGLGLLSMGTLAAAKEHTIEQKDKKFSQDEIKIKVGDSIKFANKDETSHHVFSSSDGLKFNLGVQKPGEEPAKTFDKPGEGEVRCAIHPQMKLKVSVEK